MVHIIIYSAEAASPPPPPPVYMLVIEFEEVNFLPDTNLRRVPFGHALGHILSQSVTAPLIVQHSDGDSEIRRLMTMTRGAMFSVIKPDWSRPSGWLATTGGSGRVVLNGSWKWQKSKSIMWKIGVVAELCSSNSLLLLCRFSISNRYSPLFCSVIRWSLHSTHSPARSVMMIHVKWWVAHSNTCRILLKIATHSLRVHGWYERHRQRMSRYLYVFLNIQIIASSLSFMSFLN